MVRAHQLRLMALPLMLAGVLLLFFSNHKTVTLLSNGQSYRIKTTVLTVGQLLRSQNISLVSQDRLSPPVNHWLIDGDVIRLDKASQVWIEADGKTVSFTSIERIPANLLQQASIPLFAGDQILDQGDVIKADQALSPAPFFTLSLRRAIKIQIQDGKQVKNLTSTSTTLGQALWNAGLLLHSGDLVSPTLETSLSFMVSHNLPAEVEATLTRSTPLTIHIGKQKVNIRSTASTVGEALRQAGLPLQSYDYSIPGESQTLPKDGQIRIVRVRESVIIEQEPLAFQTEYQPAGDLEIDQRKVLQAGEYGLKAHRVRVRYEDGVEISRQVDAEWIARKPRNQMIGYGTKIIMHTLRTPDGTIRYWRALQMWATSYHPSEAGDGTASGLPLKKGVAAVDTRYIPFFTNLYIPGYGKAVAGDIGSGVQGRWIDLAYSDENYESWHQWVTVYFLWPPPDNVVWYIP
ncbi:MAG: ubiquitin-like domain-containing protein [Omnitrophica WOR_2 bacterium]